MYLLRKLVYKLHKLCSFRESIGLTVAELANEAGVSRGVIYEIESGLKKYKVNYTVAEALAEALEVHVYDIFTKTEVSELGRPAHTGKPLTLTVISSCEMICSGCNLAVPRAVGCDTCAVAA